MIKVSVIIPVYNSGQYLCECLDSVVNQTLKDIEIICVDDCSTDFSRNLLKRYAASDGRIRILQNERNKGQAFSKNRAIEVAAGEYIQFLDSDDCLNGENVLEDLYSLSVRNKLDLLKSEYYLRKLNATGGWLRYPVDIVGEVYSGRDLLYELEFQDVSAWGGCTNFVKLDFLRENGISFYEGMIHEDVLYSYDLYYYAERAMCIDLCTYIYVKRPGSTTTRKKDINHLRGYLICVNEILKRDFLTTGTNFKYATIKYFLQMYHNVTGILRELGSNDVTGLSDNELLNLYSMFWKGNYGGNINNGNKANHVRYIKTEKILNNLALIVESKKIYIFGAGKAAQELLELLDVHDITVSGIFVTDMERSAKTLLGHRVMGIDSYEHSDRETLFLVAITKKYVGDTIDILRAKGIENIIYVC